MVMTLAILAYLLYTLIFALNKIIFLTVRYVVKWGIVNLTHIAKEIIKCHSYIPFKKYMQRSASH